MAILVDASAHGTHGGLPAPILVITSFAIIYREFALGRESSNLQPVPIQSIPSNAFRANLPSTRGASPPRVKRREQFAPLDKPPQILHPRKDYDGTTYCQAQTNTFIVIVSFNAANAAVSSFLTSCLIAVQRDINNGNTGLIPSDGWYGPLGRNGLSMTVWSEDNYQTTYGVLHSAIQALIGWMSSNDNTFGTGSFTVWDGNNQVGHGSING